MKRNWFQYATLSLVVICAGTILSTQVSAQQTQPASTTQATSNVPPAGTIGDRKENQQDRIAQGVKSGQLTPGETSRLENKEAGLNKEIRTDRKANGGNLTDNQKKQVNRQQNKLSKDIYKDKHNNRVQHPK